MHMSIKIMAGKAVGIFVQIVYGFKQERIVCGQSHYTIERQTLGFKIRLLSANI